MGKKGPKSVIAYALPVATRVPICLMTQIKRNIRVGVAV